MATPSTVMPGRVSVADQRLSIARRFDEHENLADGAGITTAEVIDANQSVAQSMQDMQTDMLRTSAGQYVRGAIGGSLHADLIQLLTIDLSIDSNTDAEHEILMEKINTFVEHQLDVIEVNGDEFTSLQAQLMETKMKEIEEATNLLSSLAIGSHPAPAAHPNDGMTDSERADHQIRTDQFAANTRELHALYHEVVTAEGILDRQNKRLRALTNTRDRLWQGGEAEMATAMSMTVAHEDNLRTQINSTDSRRVQARTQLYNAAARIMGRDTPVIINKRNNNVDTTALKELLKLDLHDVSNGADPKTADAMRAQLKLFMRANVSEFWALTPAVAMLTQFTQRELHEWLPTINKDFTKRVEGKSYAEQLHDISFDPSADSLPPTATAAQRTLYDTNCKAQLQSTVIAYQTQNNLLFDQLKQCVPKAVDTCVAGGTGWIGDVWGVDGSASRADVDDGISVVETWFKVAENYGEDARERHKTKVTHASGHLVVKDWRSGIKKLRAYVYRIMELKIPVTYQQTIRKYMSDLTAFRPFAHIQLQREWGKPNTALHPTADVSQEILRFLSQLENIYQSASAANMRQQKESRQTRDHRAYIVRMSTATSHNDSASDDDDDDTSDDDDDATAHYSAGTTPRAGARRTPTTRRERGKPTDNRRADNRGGRDKSKEPWWKDCTWNDKGRKMCDVAGGTWGKCNNELTNDEYANWRSLTEEKKKKLAERGKELRFAVWSWCDKCATTFKEGDKLDQLEMPDGYMFVNKDVVRPEQPEKITGRNVGRRERLRERANLAAENPNNQVREQAQLAHDEPEPASPSPDDEITQLRAENKKMHDERASAANRELQHRAENAERQLAYVAHRAYVPPHQRTEGVAVEPEHLRSSFPNSWPALESPAVTFSNMPNIQTFDRNIPPSSHGR